MLDRDLCLAVPPTRQVDVGAVRAGEVEWDTERFGEGAAYGGRFVRFGPWRDLAVENSYVAAVSDQGELCSTFGRSVTAARQTSQPSVSPSHRASIASGG
jgi:hypothetical protein